jgi:hypothetical protein
MVLVLFWTVLALILFYFVVSALIANGMAMPLRRPIYRTPTSLGVVFEDVSFHSRADNVLLKGWYIPTIIKILGGFRVYSIPSLMKYCPVVVIA